MLNTKQKSLGQYFTINEELQQYVFDKVKYKGGLLLEPSFGAGHLLKPFKDSNPNYPMHCYELDSTVKPVIEFNQSQKVVYDDFTAISLLQHYKTIIGNPPYVKTKSGNLYIRFIELCYNYLAEDGELIFIVPSDFLKLTSASSLISKMTSNGSFTDFLFPHNERLFEGANIDVVVFRYQKGLQQPTAIVNGNEMFCNVSNGIITFSAEVSGHRPTVHELFDVYVGLVSGRDEIYRQPFGNIRLLQDKGKVESFIFPEVFPTQSQQINQHLLAHKEELLGRKIKTFTEANWFEWGAPRNIRTIRSKMGQPCIYVRNMTRQKEVAFAGTVQLFGGSLLCLIPKQEMELQPVLNYFNSPEFQKDYLYSGRFKIGHKQISNAFLP